MMTFWFFVNDDLGYSAVWPRRAPPNLVTLGREAPSDPQEERNYGAEFVWDGKERERGGGRDRVILQEHEGEVVCVMSSADIEEEEKKERKAKRHTCVCV